MQTLEFQRKNVKHSRSTKPTEDPFFLGGNIVSEAFNENWEEEEWERKKIRGR